MKMIGKILRGYFYFLIFAAIAGCILQIVNPDYKSSEPLVNNSGEDYKRPIKNAKHKTVKLIPYDDSKNTAWFKQRFEVDEVLITYICEVSDGGATFFNSLESVTPQESYKLITNELNDKSGTLNYDLCRDTETTTVGLDDIYVRIVPQ